MARKRPRHKIGPNYRFNDVLLEGLLVVRLGESSWTGRMKTQDGKRLPKRDYTHYLFRVEDKKFLRQHNLPSPMLLTAPKKGHERYFIPVGDE